MDSVDSEKGVVCEGGGKEDKERCLQGAALIRAQLRGRGAGSVIRRSFFQIEGYNHHH